MSDTERLPAPAPPNQALPTLAEVWRALRSPALVLVVAVLVWALAFRQEITAAVRVWDASTAYSHCFFVLPIALWLLWERRAEILAAPVVPLPWLGLLALPGTLVWFAVERIGIMEGRQLVAISLLELLFLAVLGWRMAWAASGGLLYLFFLVPFGAFLTPILQDWTAWFTDIGLFVSGIPYNMDGLIIEIPEGRFYIAEACAGLRFLIASIAFGVLYALLMYRSWTRRAVFIIASIAVPIVANWFRALGIVVLGHFLGSAEAAAADHIIYGWVFFSFVTLVLIIVGLPFRQDLERPPLERAAPAPPPGRLVPAAGIAALLLAIGPAAAAVLDGIAARAAPASPAIAWVAPPGCRIEPIPTPAGASAARVVCQQVSVTLTAQAFSPRTTWNAIVRARIAITAEDLAEETSSTNFKTGAEDLEWRYTAASGPDLGTVLSAVLLWTNGQPHPGGFASRIRLARASILGGEANSVMLSASVRLPKDHVSPESERQLRTFLATVLQSQPGLGATVVRLSKSGG